MSHDKVICVIICVVILLLIWYFWYQSPEYLTDDQFAQAMIAQSIIQDPMDSALIMEKCLKNKTCKEKFQISNGMPLRNSQGMIIRRTEHLGNKNKVSLPYNPNFYRENLVSLPYNPNYYKE